MTKQAQANPDGYRYHLLARDLEEKIDTGMYRPGDRLPSLRDLHARTGLSITTINLAYVELERRGLIEPRAKSGYYVRPLLKSLLPSQKPASRAAGRPRKVTIDSEAESILAILHDDEAALPFGAALPASQLLPTRQLARSAQQIAARYFNGPGIKCSSPNGIAELKRQIAGRTIGYRRPIDEDEVVITCGCMDAIQLCLRAIAKAGDTIVTESPTFTCYLQLIRDLGLLALEIPTDPHTGIDLNILEKALDHNRAAACLLNPTFQNPLGFDMPAERKERLVKMLAQRQIPIVEDDIFGELYFGASRPLPLKHFDTTGQVLYCSSFSKTLAPDFRVGWVVPGRYKDRIDRLKFNAYTVPSKLPQFILADFLQNGHYDRHLRKLRGAFRQQVSATIQAIARYFPQGTKLTAPAGGYILWIELDKQIDGMELFRLARSRNILFIPGAIATNTGRAKNCIRISCGHPFTDRLEEGIRTLGQLTGELAAGQ